MRKSCVMVLTLLLTLTVHYGCGGDPADRSSHSPVLTSRILSNQSADGDIAFTHPSTYVISSANITFNVLAGVHPSTGEEFRGFLDFPLGDSEGVPLDATIVSATLEITIKSVTVEQSGDTVPMILDLVYFQPPSLVSTDFDCSIQPPLLSEPFVIFTSDAGSNVAIDVTPLMEEAQRRELADLQVRLLLDFSAATGLIEIDDGAAVTAPSLTVQYYE